MRDGDVLCTGRGEDIFAGQAVVSGVTAGVPSPKRFCIRAIIDMKSNKLDWLMYLGKDGKNSEIESSVAGAWSVDWCAGVSELAGSAALAGSAPLAGSATFAGSADFAGLAKLAGSAAIAESSDLAGSGDDDGLASIAGSSELIGSTGDCITVMVLLSVCLVDTGRV